MKKTNISVLPELAQLEAELKREGYRRRFATVLRSTIYTLITVTVLVAALWMPVLQIYGTSMFPTLTNGDVVISVKESEFKPGELQHA